MVEVMKISEYPNKRAICLDNLKTVTKFVEICNRFNTTYNVQIDIIKGRYTIDATSLMGVAAMCPYENTYVSMLTDNEDLEAVFYETINEFVIEE